MNVDVLTIGNVFSQPAASALPGLRSDSPTENTRHTYVTEHSEVSSDAAKGATPDQSGAEAPRESVPQGRKGFREVIEDGTKPAETTTSRNHSESTNKNVESNTSEQSECTQAVVVQKLAAEKQKKVSSAPRIEQNTKKLEHPYNFVIGRFTSRITETGPRADIRCQRSKKDGAKGKKAQPAISEAIKSPEIKPLPKTSNATTVQTKAAAGKFTASTTNADVDNNVKTYDTGKKTTSAASPAEAESARTPATDTKQVMKQIPDTSTNKSANTVQTNTSPSASHQSTAKSAAAVVTRQTPTESFAISTDKANSTAQVLPQTAEKSQPATEIDAEPISRQTPSKQTGTPGRKLGYEDHNIENPASKTSGVQIPTVRMETGDSHASNDGLSRNSAQVLSPNAAQTPVSEQTTMFSVETKAPNLSEQAQTATGSEPSDAGRQVLESVRSLWPSYEPSQPTGDKEITIQLNPPELGRVCVKFQEQGAEITGTLEVSKAQTRAEIEQALPEIIRNLTDSGITIKRLEVVLSQNEQSGSQARDPLLQDGQFNQQNHSNPNQSGDQHQTAYAYGPTTRTRYQYLNPTAPQEMLVANNSINMLV